MSHSIEKMIVMIAGMGERWEFVGYMYSYNKYGGIRCVLLYNARQTTNMTMVAGICFYW